MFYEDDEEPRSSDRTFYRYLAMALLIPAAVVGVLALLVDDGSERGAGLQSFFADLDFELFGDGDRERMQLAAALLDTYTQRNPPNGVWRQQAVEVVDGRTVKMTVEVPYRQHAYAIMTRRQRIQYSYVKLACPPPESGIGEYMTDEDRIVVELHHQGEPIAEGTCPRNPFSL